MADPRRLARRRRCPSSRSGSQAACLRCRKAIGSSSAATLDARAETVTQSCLDPRPRRHAHGGDDRAHFLVVQAFADRAPRSAACLRPVGCSRLRSWICRSGASSHRVDRLDRRLRSRCHYRHHGNPRGQAGDVGRVSTPSGRVVSRSARISSSTNTTDGGFLPLNLEGGGFWPPFAVAIAGGGAPLDGGFLLFHPADGLLCWLRGRSEWLALPLVCPRRLDDAAVRRVRLRETRSGFPALQSTEQVG